ncbi:MAG TPA: class I SAM-dependent methyltransferase [Patescibacteria group bacterium]|nr:class I SAM-dependent methyltransferase [Patescibacteria group bacterium]
MGIEVPTPSHRAYASDMRFDSVAQYGGTALYLISREKVYGHTREGVTMHDRLHKEGLANLRGDETVVDLGCGYGRTLRKLRDRGHKGHLVGFDANDTWSVLPPKDLKGLDLILKDARNTELPDESADVVILEKSIYHFPNILPEVYRIMKPGARAEVTTSGEYNKTKQRILQELIIRAINNDNQEEEEITSPVDLAAPFKSAKMYDLMPVIFDTVVKHEPIQTIMIINGLEALEDYVGSIDSMSTTCNPPIPGGIWHPYTLRHAVPLIKMEWHLNGRYSDFIDQHWMTGYKKAA